MPTQPTQEPAHAPSYVTLYRPVGQRELELIAESSFTAFPPRLPEQPIFYPVTNAEYATQIARDWNTKDKASGYCGYVTEFRVDAAFLSRYPVQTVGRQGLHDEYWIPADDLPAFNAALINNGGMTGAIAVITHFRGENAPVLETVP